MQLLFGQRKFWKLPVLDLAGYSVTLFNETSELSLKKLWADAYRSVCPGLSSMRSAEIKTWVSLLSKSEELSFSSRTTAYLTGSFGKVAHFSES